MIVNTEEREIKSFGELSEAKFGVSDNDQAHILSILRDKLYSDKIMAVIREYSTNAVDAHVESGQATLPIKVHIPTLTDPHFRVRDYGTGLSEDAIYNLYVRYGASTKRNTNDSIGQLGLGCKSGFAYSDNYTIISYFEGKRMVFHAYIDETNIGLVKKLYESESDEPTGIEISIPVATEDFPAFKQRAQRCFYYFDIKPDINCTIPTREALVEGSFWRVRKDTDQVTAYNINRVRAAEGEPLLGPVAIMGNIGYPIDVDQIAGDSAEAKNILAANLELKFKIGALSISASREALEYTENTVSSIRGAIKEMVREVSDHLAEQFEECNTEYELRSKYVELYSDASLGNYYRNLVNNAVNQLLKGKWQDSKAFRTSIDSLLLPDGCKLSPQLLEPSESKFRSIGWRAGFIINSNNIIVCINDCTSKWVLRALELRAQYEKNNGTIPYIIMLTPNGDKESFDYGTHLEAYLKYHGLRGAPVTYLSKVDPPKNGSGASAMTNERKAKLKGNIFTLKSGVTRVSNSQHWELCENFDPAEESGVYVLIDRFKPVGLSPYDVLNQLKSLSEFLGKPITLYGFKVRAKGEITEDWMHLTEFYSKALEEKLEDDNLLEDLGKFLSYRELSRYHIVFQQYLAHRDKFINQDNLLLEICEKEEALRKFNNSLSYDKKKELIETEKHIGARGVDWNSKLGIYPFHDKMERVGVLYPLLSRIDAFNWYSYSRNKDIITDIIDYVNAIDRMKE